MIQQEVLDVDLLETLKEETNLISFSDLITQHRNTGRQLVVKQDSQSLDNTPAKQCTANELQPHESHLDLSNPSSILITRLLKHQFNQINFYEPLNAEVKSSFLQRYRDDERMHELLFKLIELSSINPDFTQAASNALHLLNLSNADFFQRNLSSSNIKNTSIAGGLFLETTFEGSQFEKVDISSALFLDANLKSTNWRGIECIEHQILEFYATDMHWQRQTLAFSTDSTLLAHSSRGNFIVITNVRTNEQIRKFQGSRGNIQQLSFALDNKLLSISTLSTVIQLWDLQLGEPQQRSQQLQSVNQKRQVRSATVFKEFHGHKDQVLCAEFSTDGKLLVSGSKDNSVRVWNSVTGGILQILHKHNVGVVAVSFSPDHKSIASGDSEGCIWIWNTESGCPLICLQDDIGNISALRFLSASEILASGQKNMAKRWSLSDGAQLGKFPLRPRRFCQVAISPGGHYIAQTLYRSQIIVIDTESGETVACFSSDGKADGLAFSNDGQLLATTFSDGHVRLWRVFDFKQVGSCPLDFFGVVSLDFTTDGRVIAFQGESITIRSLPSWTLEQSITKVQLEEFVSALNNHNGDFSKVNKPLFEACSGLMKICGSPSSLRPMIASSKRKIIAIIDNENWIQIWNSETHVLLQKIEQGPSPTSFLSLSPSDNILATASLDQWVKFYEYLSGKVIFTLRPNELISQIFYSVDGNLIATIGDRMILTVREARTGRVVRFWMGHEDNRILTSADFSRDKRLVLSSGDITINVWNLVNGAEVDSVKSINDQPVIQAMFSPEGEMIFSINEDLTLTIWARAVRGRFYLRKFIRLPGGLIARNIEIDQKTKILSASKINLIPCFCHEDLKTVENEAQQDSSDENDDDFIDESLGD